MCQYTHFAYFFAFMWVLIEVAASPQTLAQPCIDWERLNLLPRADHVMAFDSVHKKTIMLGGTNSSYFTGMWEWDGRQWSPRDLDIPQTNHAAMAFDESRGVIVLVNSNQTWEFAGDEWVLRATEGPVARNGHQIVYGGVRGGILLFGGTVYNKGTTYPQDTWLWDGSTWTQISTKGPPGRTNHAMAWDSVRAKIVMYGGANQEWLSDTWEWDGSVWTLQASLIPKARIGHAMAYHPELRRTILTGGYIDGYDSATWSWDGKSWQFEPAVGLSGRADHAMAYDSARQSLVLFGGRNGTTLHGDTLELGGDEGTPLMWDMRDDHPVPINRIHASITFDKARLQTIMFGGSFGPNILFNETWAWDGDKWSLRSMEGPSPRYSAAITYDDERQVVVLFGGQGASSKKNDTWEWNGENWSLRATTGPPALSGACLAYDSARKVSVLFGGALEMLSFPSGMVWEWDGTTWSQAPTGPQGRVGHVMSFDDLRNRVVVHGGVSWVNTYLADTWEYDGNAWTLRATTGPSSRTRHAATFSSQLGRMIIHGGYSPGAGTLSDVWQWNGFSGAWTLVQATSPVTNVNHGIAFDMHRDALVVYSGSLSIGFGGGASDTWEIQMGIGGDATGDGLVNVQDVLAIIQSWGICPKPRQSCPGDLSPCGQNTKDGMIDVQDLLIVISNWTG